MKVGTRADREHGALRLAGIIKQGERRPFAHVDIYWQGHPVGHANASAAVISEGPWEDGAHRMTWSIVSQVAVRLARFMEAAR